MATRLSVNLNKIAVLRNSRGGAQPSVLDAARCVVDAGARGITVHPRPDCRHIRPSDVYEIAAWLPEGIEFNIEGNPFAEARDGYPGFLALVEAVRPHQVTVVPDSDHQVTSDHGFDLAREVSVLAPVIARCHAIGSRVSAFVDAGSVDFAMAAELGLDRIEIYTGPFAESFQRVNAERAEAACRATAVAASVFGLGVNAGHDLSQANLSHFLASVPGVLEVSIGHALIGEALYAGLKTTVRTYLRLTGELPN
ncbi:MAG: pyridoxine 5'-phosphate synthase [Aquimonas sp.]|nr:pyridoxine 5'-phosphate synthase [Xanthomonadales bacterium]MCC6504773.1 pyridoxine 5'-phosphate synthase [Aquimonas sp.]